MLYNDDRNYTLLEEKGLIEEVRKWTREIAHNYNHDIDTNLLSQLIDVKNHFGLHWGPIDHRFQWTHVGETITPQRVFWLITGREDRTPGFWTWVSEELCTLGLSKEAALADDVAFIIEELCSSTVTDPWAATFHRTLEEYHAMPFSDKLWLIRKLAIIKGYMPPCVEAGYMCEKCRLVECLNACLWSTRLPVRELVKRLRLIEYYTGGD